MVLLGLWLTHFPVLAASIGVAIYMILYGYGIAGFLFFWVMIALCCYAVVVLYRVTRNYVTIPKKDPTGSADVRQPRHGSGLD